MEAKLKLATTPWITRYAVSAKKALEILTLYSCKTCFFFYYLRKQGHLFQEKKKIYCLLKKKRKE